MLDSLERSVHPDGSDVVQSPSIVFIDRLDQLGTVYLEYF